MYPEICKSLSQEKRQYPGSKGATLRRQTRKLERFGQRQGCRQSKACPACPGFAGRGGGVRNGLNGKIGPLEKRNGSSIRSVVGCFGVVAMGVSVNKPCKLTGLVWPSVYWLALACTGLAGFTL